MKAVTLRHKVKRSVRDSVAAFETAKEPGLFNVDG